MRLATWIGHSEREAAVLLPDSRLVTLNQLNARHGTRWAGSVEGVIMNGEVRALGVWLSHLADGDLEALTEPYTASELGPLYRSPGKIWGIGLNFMDHANDLGANRPDEPASFMRPVNTISDPGAGIRLPASSQRVTAEAEMGLVIGRRARYVSAENALDYVAGVVAVLDMTAEDILQRNPRFLTRAKSFDTFFSFGPVLVTLDEFPDLDRVEVATVVNGTEVRRNTLDHMIFDPAHLVAFHSEVFEWQPGDILSTGTPGAGVIQPGDVVEARVADLLPLCQTVAC